MMIGILCSNNKLNAYIQGLERLLRELALPKEATINVFTINNVNIPDLNILGTLISRAGTRVEKTTLPTIIINLSRQRSSDCIKKLKQLVQVPHIKVINQANRLNQLMIQEIMESSPETKKYLLERTVYQNNMDPQLPLNCSYLLMPEKGTSLSSLLYIKGGQRYHQIYHSKDSPGFWEQSTLQLPKGNFILLSTEELFTANNRPIIIRLHGYNLAENNNNWLVYERPLFYNTKSVDKNIIENLDKAFQTTCTYLRKFIPSLGICYADFVINKNNPILLHIGGWDPQLLRKEQGIEFFKSILLHLSQGAFAN